MFLNKFQWFILYILILAIEGVPGEDYNGLLHRLQNGTFNL